MGVYYGFALSIHPSAVRSFRISIWQCQFLTLADAKHCQPIDSTSKSVIFFLLQRRMSRCLTRRSRSFFLRGTACLVLSLHAQSFRVCVHRDSRDEVLTL